MNDNKKMFFIGLLIAFVCVTAFVITLAATGNVEQSIEFAKWSYGGMALFTFFMVLFFG